MIESLRRALSAESLKLRRTLALRLALALPAVPCALQLLNYLQRGETLLPEGVNPWAWLAQNVLIIWSVFLLPLFVALETSLLSGIEQASQGFKHLHALPVPRWSIQAAKLLTAFGLMGVATVCLWAYTLAAGGALRLLKPGLGFDQPIPWWQILLTALLAYAASWFMLAVHVFISLRWPGLVLNVGVALGALFVSFAVTNTSLWRVWPWSLPAVAQSLGSRQFLDLGGSMGGASLWLPVSCGVIGGLLVALLGGRFLSRCELP